MTTFEIVEGRAHHCGQMIRLLRADHARAVAMIGVDAHRALRDAFEQSFFRRAWLIDHKLAGLGGVTGTSLDGEAQVWLALSQAAMRYPVEIVREARRQLDQIMVLKRRLITSIVAGDQTAQRFAVFVGFVPLAVDGVSRAESRYGRRMLYQMMDAPELRVQTGRSYSVPLVYVPQEAA